MDADLATALEDPTGITLVISPAERDPPVAVDILGELAGEREMSGVYTTVNRSAADIEELLERHDVPTDQLFFIDAVSVQSGEPGERDDTIFLRSPEHLTDISIAMNGAMQELPGDDRFAMFDSVSTLTVYNELGTVSRFVHHLTSKMRAWTVQGIVLSLPDDTDESLLDRLGQFCDHVVRPD